MAGRREPRRKRSTTNAATATTMATMPTTMPTVEDEALVPTCVAGLGRGLGFTTVDRPSSRWAHVLEVGSRVNPVEYGAVHVSPL